MSTAATKSKPGRTGSRSGSKTSKARASKSKAKSTAAKAKTAGTKTANTKGGKRLSPGALDGLVLGYMKRSRVKLPVTAGTVGRGIKRSSGAVANCLERLERAGKVKLTNKKPREYELVADSK